MSHTPTTSQTAVTPDARIADDIVHLVARAERYGLDANRIARIRHHAAQLLDALAARAMRSTSSEGAADA